MPFSQKEYRLKNRDRINSNQRRWRLRNPERFSILQKHSIQKKRLQCLVHYGGNPPKCACCGESYIKFLTLDHLDGHGREEVKKFGYRSGSYFYGWLIKNGFPILLQVMCYNCNCSKKDSGNQFCPVHHPELYEVK